MFEHKCLIEKAKLTFAAKFFWLLVWHLLSPTAVDNILTWDGEVLVASLVDGLEIDFVRLLIIVIHERDFKSSITYPFACMIFQLCTSAGVTIWQINVLRTPTGSVDIGIIQDEAIEVGPRRGPRVEVQPLRENLEDTVKHA